MAGMTPSPVPLTARWKSGLRFIAVSLSAALIIGLSAGVSRGDDLTDQQKKIRQQISQTQGKVNSANETVNTATEALAQSRQELSQAQAELAYVQQQLAEAEAAEQRMKEALKKAEDELAAAQKEVEKGEKEVAAQEAVIGQAVRGAYQQHTDLANLALVVAGEDAKDIASRLQWNTTVFDSTSAELDRLQTLQLQLEGARARKAAAQQLASDNKAAATEQVQTTAALEEQAQVTQATVQSLVQQNAKNEAAAQAELDEYEKQLQGFKSEDDRVAKLIQARIAAQKLAAAKKAAAQRAAREAAARKNATKSSSSSSSSSNSSSNSGGSYTAGTSSWGFVYPTNVTWVSSPYGTRVDPISGSVAFHSGTDFPANCGTPIKAARAGRVTDRYYQSSYGNRLVIDHGAINGVYLSTAYNHAQSYIVSVGQYVQRGQTIGYIGTTGRSTGCHMHFQVYENGSLANPMRFL